MVNGSPGLMVRFPARTLLGAFTVVDGRIVEINIIADREKLRGVH
jgi:RNA polymerase sigma-70 factor (ECF subfamily)